MGSGCELGSLTSCALTQPAGGSTVGAVWPLYSGAVESTVTPDLDSSFGMGGELKSKTCCRTATDESANLVRVVIPSRHTHGCCGHRIGVSINTGFFSVICQGQLIDLLRSIRRVRSLRVSHCIFHVEANMVSFSYFNFKSSISLGYYVS